MSVNILDSNRHLKSIAGGDIPIATNLNAGKVKPDGTTITITQDGTISAVEADPTPIATTEVAGKVKPDGTTITITQDGTISGVDATPIATTSTPGIVKPDGNYLGIDNTGLLNFDPNTKKLDRSKLFIEPVYTYAYGITGKSMGSVYTKTTKICEITGNKGGSCLYLINFNGYSQVGSDNKNIIHQVWVQVGSSSSTQSSDPGSYIQATGGIAGYKGYISLNASGLMILTLGEELYLREEWPDWSSGANITSFTGHIFVTPLYSLNNRSIGTTEWWQQNSLPDY